jgi:hypothetical protein
VSPLTDSIAITLLKDGISQRIKLMFLMEHLTLFRWGLIATHMMEWIVNQNGLISQVRIFPIALLQTTKHAIKTLELFAKVHQI